MYLGMNPQKVSSLIWEYPLPNCRQVSGNRGSQSVVVYVGMTLAKMSSGIWDGTAGDAALWTSGHGAGVAGVL